MSTTTEDDKVEMMPGLDWGALSISAEAGFVLSRLSGAMRVKDLLATTGLPRVKAREIIHTLVDEGVLLVNGEVRAKMQGVRPTRSDDSAYEGFIFSPADLAEEAELSDEQKKRILYIHAHLDEWSHYALLKLKRTAKKRDIKRGYFLASKEFHPDTFFRKNLGAYESKVSDIFRAMKVAYDELSDEKRRAIYDENLGADFTPVELAELKERAERVRQEITARRLEEEKKERAKARAQRLADSRKDRRRKRNPVLQNIKRGQELAALAKAALDGKDFKAALRHAKLALDYAKDHPSVQEEVREVIEAAQEREASRLAKACKNALAPEDDFLRDSAMRIVELAPKHAELVTAAARIFDKLGDVHNARKWATAVTVLAPDETYAWELLYDIAERGEQWYTALRAAEKLRALAPGDKQAKEKWKRAKKQAN